MGLIYVPERKIQANFKPDFPVEIDWENPLTKGLSLSLLASQSLRDLVTDENWSTFGTAPVFGVGKRGRDIDASAAYGGVYLASTKVNTAGAAQTHAIVCDFISISGPYAGLLTSANAAGTSASLTLQDPGAASSFAIYTSNTTYADTVLADTAPFGPSVIVISGDVSGCDLYKDGIVLATSPNVLTAQTNSRIVIFGERSASATYASKGRLYFHASWNRRLSAVEKVAFSKNPYQLLRPKQRKLWVSGGSSNNFYGNAYQKINSLGGMSVSMPVSAASIQSVTSSAATTGSTPLSGSATQTIASIASFNVALYLAANAIQSVLSSANLAGSSPLLGNNTETITSSGNITSTVIPSYLSGASLQEIVSTATLQASAILHGGAIIDSFSGATFYIPSGGVGQNPNSASIAYSPGKVPDNVPDLQRFLTLQLSQIAAVIRLLAAGHIDVTYVAPAKPRDGDIRYADGTKWNPGSGSGVYRYDGTAWHYLG
jgi:hypothetical protein